jgi:LysM repeat protein
LQSPARFLICLGGFVSGWFPGKPGGYYQTKEMEMKITRSFVFLLILVLIASLAACKRNVPGGEEATPVTSEPGEVLTPAATDVMEQIYLFATQTAMALGGQTGEPVAQGTPGAPEAAQPVTTQAVMTEPPAAVQPTTAPIQIAPPTPGRPAAYTLKGGEFPYCIARRFNVDPGELLRLNGLSAYSVFYSGMTLQIPQTGHTFPGNRSLRPHPTTYTVSPGDTIYNVACAFGEVDPEAIAAANGLAKPYGLTPGQVLHIP